ncbi:hypothetical protein [Stappia sp.]|jgi:hypothetical protein|uniref:hypothetical protein n=1 Tax=Stappia sp. TaxID=1870903 RepID=UPI003A9A5AAF
MRISALAALLMFVCPATSLAAEDMFIVSRLPDGSFHSGHRLYDRTGSNLHKVTFCGRPYFVRAKTVAWMNYEADEGRVVGLEFNVGKGWVHVCKDPADQVKLADIGIDEDNVDVMYASDEALNRRDRFRHISRAFSGFKNSGNVSSSYHAR